MKALQHFLFEFSPWSPSFTALAVGFAEIGLDGKMYLTAAGLEYLEGTE